MSDIILRTPHWCLEVSAIYFGWENKLSIYFHKFNLIWLAHKLYVWKRFISLSSWVKLLHLWWFFLLYWWKKFFQLQPRTSMIHFSFICDYILIKLLFFFFHNGRISCRKLKLKWVEMIYFRKMILWPESKTRTDDIDKSFGRLKWFRSSAQNKINWPWHFFIITQYKTQ